MKAADLMIDDLIRTPRGIEKVECPGQRSVVTKSGCYGIDDVKPIVFTDEMAENNRITISRDMAHKCYIYLGEHQRQRDE